jgi:hypothetical protein
MADMPNDVEELAGMFLSAMHELDKPVPKMKGMDFEAHFADELTTLREARKTLAQRIMYGQQVSLKELAQTTTLAGWLLMCARQAKQVHWQLEQREKGECSCTPERRDRGCRVHES